MSLSCEHGGLSEPDSSVKWVRQELALGKKKGMIKMPLEGLRAGVQIRATHSLSEPGTFALLWGFHKA